MSDMIQKGDFESIRDTTEHSTDTGMITFESSVFEAYTSGKISKEEALANVDSKGNLQTRIRLARVSEQSDDDEFSVDRGSSY